MLSQTRLALPHTGTASPALMWIVVLHLNNSIKERGRPVSKIRHSHAHSLLVYFIRFQTADILNRNQAQKVILWPSIGVAGCCGGVVAGIIKLIKWLQNIIKLHILCCVPNLAQCCEPFSSLRPAVVCGSTEARHQTLPITHFSLYKICCLPSPSLIQYFDS